MRTAELDAAFRATTYRVRAPEGLFELRIGGPNPAFDDFLRRQRVSCWGMVTAYNPGGVRCDEDNPLFQRRLQERVQALGWPWLASSIYSDTGEWPVEPGFLLLQVNEDEVCRLASEFSQLACVCGDTGGVPRLIWV